MLPRSFISGTCVLFSFAALLFPAAARAQTLDRALAARPSTLARQRVPLLVVDPAHTPPEKGAAGTADALTALAARYERKVVALGSITVLAPSRMARIAPPPHPPRDRRHTVPEGWQLSLDPHPVSKLVTEELAVPAGASPENRAFYLVFLLPGSGADHRPAACLKADATLLDLSAMSEARAHSFVEGILAPAAAR